MTTTTKAHTDYIARDTYAGKWTTVRRDPNIGCRKASWIAEQYGAEGQTIIVWEYFGEVRPGKHGFCRTRFVARNGNLVAESVR